MSGDLFITSDLHLNHTNIIQYCGRPFSCVEEMNEKIIDNWNNTVKAADTIYVVGDIVMGLGIEIPNLLSRLKGKIVLVVGNHDKSKMKFIRPFMSEVHRSLEFEFEDKLLLVDHIPKFVNLDPKFDFQLCGHVHEKFLIKENAINVGVDLWNFKPTLIEQVIDTYTKNVEII